MLLNYFHNSSIFCIWLSAVAAFILPTIIQNKGISKLSAMAFVCITLSAVILLGGRAGLLGLGAASIFIYRKSNLTAYLRKKPVFFAFLAAAFLLLLYVSKPGSSSGRLHIYSISLQILKNNWLTGIGIGKFKAAFNEYQAAYFMQHDIDSKRALLADNTFYAFNDYLQWVAETGIGGFILLACFGILLIKRTSCLLKHHQNNPMLKGAVAALISLSVSAFFSYPLQVLPIQLTALACLGIILFFPLSLVAAKRSAQIVTVGIRSLYFIICTFFIYHSICYIQTKSRERKAFQFSITGKKRDALELYKKLATHYPAYGYNKYLYAEHCYYMNETERADSALAEAQKTYTDNKVYSLKARINVEKGNLKDAEQYFLKAIYMVPNRMAFRYDIVQFYIENKDTAKALHWAYSIKKMPVKVPSEKINWMLSRTDELIKKITNKMN